MEGDPYNSDPQDVSLMSEEVGRSKGPQSPQMDDFGMIEICHFTMGLRFSRSGKHHLIKNLDLKMLGKIMVNHWDHWG